MNERLTFSSQVKIYLIFSCVLSYFHPGHPVKPSNAASLSRTPASVEVSTESSLKVPSPWKSRGEGVWDGGSRCN
ncbi:hypothetical protein DPMN_188480 [Dreissena polymorpha]|uniref:Uncharacterized protein n=1 Tax=Dreissena polymorpha TaxID=45954 RepID=A0A9D4DT20_DREPO|nr:hypothetical protein DPMN_188480 [Dreissena polymorpha]